MTVAELIAQLQQFDGNMHVTAFAHNTAQELDFYGVEICEENGEVEESVTLHFNVE